MMWPAFSKGFDIFTLHPVFNALMATILYVASMQYYHQDGRDIRAKRWLHGLMMCSLLLMLSVSSSAVIFDKWRKDESLVPSSLHAMIGAAAIALLLVQIAAGMFRLANFELRNASSAAWHNKLGRLLAPASFGVVSLGIMNFFGYFSKMALLSTCSYAVLVYLTLWAYRVGKTRKSEGKKH